MRSTLPISFANELGWVRTDGRRAARRIFLFSESALVVSKSWNYLVFQHFDKKKVRISLVVSPQAFPEFGL